MKKLEKYITDERTGLKYELVGDYYYIAGDDEPEEDYRPIGIWGQRHLQYIKRHKIALYTVLFYSCKLDDYLANVNEQAEDMLLQLVKQLAKQEGVTEELKRRNQMAWVGAMNNIRNRAEEIIMKEVICV